MAKFTGKVPLSVGAQLHQMFIMELSMYGEFEARMFVQKLPPTRRHILTAYWQENKHQDYINMVYAESVGA